MGADRTGWGEAGVAATCLVLALALAAGAEATVNVDELRGVWLAASANSVERKAAAELKEGMQRLYGLKLADAGDAGGPVVIVGRDAALGLGAVSREELERVGPQGYVLAAADGRIVIAGGGHWGTLFGVYGFLEKMGVRFFETTLSRASFPKPASRSIEAFRVAESPVFLFRSGHDLTRRQSIPMLADARTGLNPELFDPKKTGSDLWIDHTAGYLVPKLLFYDQRPEYYAVGKDGKRVGKDAFTDHRTPLCLSNPDVTSISSSRMSGLIDKNPEKQFFFVTYGDTGLWCQCPDCLKLDPSPGQYMTRNLHWVNAVARAAGAKHPDKTFMTFAYGGTDEVPPVARPDKNVWIVAATGAGCVLFWDHALAQGQASIEKVQRWAEAAPGQVLVCEYHGAYEPAMLDDNVGRLRHYRKLGVKGVVFTYGAPPNFRDVFSFVWARISWNPDQDPHALAGEYLRYAYGPAAEPLVRFFDLTRRQYQATLASADALVNHYPRNFYSGDFVRDAQACFDEAIKASAADARRLKALQTEYQRFLGDAARHLPAYDLSDGANARLLGLLEKARALADQTGGGLDFLRETQKFAAELERRTPGFRALIEKWLGASADMQPIPTQDGLRFTPQMFRGCDYGPGLFPGEAKSHPSAPCPPKVCAGVFMKTKGGRGQETSSRMRVTFGLEGARAGRKAVLSVEGQDAISHWIGADGLGWKTSVEVLVNDKAVFAGESGFVRGNWSRRDFEIPAGLLKEGENVLEFHNISKRGWFAGCWLLVTDVTLRFVEGGAR